MFLTLEHNFEQALHAEIQVLGYVTNMSAITYIKFKICFNEKLTLQYSLNSEFIKILISECQNAVIASSGFLNLFYAKAHFS